MKFLKHIQSSGVATSISGPQHTGLKQVPVWGLLGTRPHSRRWVSSKWVKLHLLPPIAPHLWHYHLNLFPSYPPSPHLWENCLPRDQSLVPKRLQTASLQDCYNYSISFNNHQFIEHLLCARRNPPEIFCGVKQMITLNKIPKSYSISNQKVSLHMDITRWLVPKSDWLYS